MAGGFVFRLLTGVSIGRSALLGLGAGFSVFLAWALCRELDPDHDLSAFFAAGLSLLGLFILGHPSLSLLFWLLLLLRIVNRTTGLQATWLDSFALLGIGGWLVHKGNWEIGLVTAAAFFLDSRLQPRNRKQVYFSCLMIVAPAVSVILRPHQLGNIGLHWGATGIALGLSVLFIPVMLGTKSLTSVGDMTGKPLVSSRVLSGQVLAVLSGTLAVLLSGASGFQALLPLWAAVVGTAVYRFFLLFFP